METVLCELELSLEKQHKCTFAAFSHYFYYYFHYDNIEFIFLRYSYDVTIDQILEKKFYSLKKQDYFHRWEALLTFSPPRSLSLETNNICTTNLVAPHTMDFKIVA